MTDPYDIDSILDAAHIRRRLQALREMGPAGHMEDMRTTCLAVLSDRLFELGE